MSDETAVLALTIDGTCDCLQHLAVRRSSIGRATTGRIRASRRVS